MTFFGAVNATPTKPAYLRARRAALRALAGYYMREVLSTQEPLSSTALEVRRQSMLQQLEKDAKEFVKAIQQMQPCDSVSPDGRPCTSVRCTHPHHRHHNPKAVEFNGFKFMRSIRKKISREGAKLSKTEWKGKFSFDDPGSEEELLGIVESTRQLLETVRGLFPPAAQPQAKS